MRATRSRRSAAYPRLPATERPSTAHRHEDEHRVQRAEDDVHPPIQGRSQSEGEEDHRARDGHGDRRSQQQVGLRNRSKRNDCSRQHTLQLAWLIEPEIVALDVARHHTRPECRELDPDRNRRFLEVLHVLYTPPRRSSWADTIDQPWRGLATKCQAARTFSLNTRDAHGACRRGLSLRAEQSPGRHWRLDAREWPPRTTPQARARP
jgi:hypothetical protein